MISPASVTSYVKAGGIINQAYMYVLDRLRPEFFTITQSNKEVSIDFNLLHNGTNPRIVAIYGDGVNEPEVYVDRGDWDHFNSLEFNKVKFPSNNVLLDTIKNEFRKDMQLFFNLPNISDNFLDFFIYKTKNSTIVKTGHPGLKIHLAIDDLVVILEFESKKKTHISVQKYFSNEFPPLTENINLKDDFDPKVAVESIIGRFKNALDLSDALIQTLTGSFKIITLKNFPSVELLNNGALVKVRLMPNYTDICVEANERQKIVSLEHMDICEIIRKITGFTPGSLSDVD